MWSLEMWDYCLRHSKKSRVVKFQVISCMHENGDWNEVAGFQLNKQVNKPKNVIPDWNGKLDNPKLFRSSWRQNEKKNVDGLVFKLYWKVCTKNGDWN